MADPNDRSLLDRLNALKPTSVTLDTSSNALDVPATGIQPAEPLSREDALAKRLKSLRQQRVGAAESESASTDPPPPYSATAEGAPSSQPRAHAPTLSPPAKRVRVEANAVGEDLGYQVDEDKTLDEILDSLVLEDDHWSVSEEGADDARRVEELLAKLKENPDAQPPPSTSKRPQDAEANEEDDDSEGENMSRQVDDVLSRTMDALKLKGPSAPTGPDRPSEPPDRSKTSEDKADTDGVESNPEDRQGAGDPDLALPAVPQTPTKEKSLPELPTTPRDREEKDAGLRLPAVPTILQDPVPTSKAGDPFESSIAARLAALKGPGHKPISTDSFGLPSAPTFQPEDRPVAGLAKKPGYTDDDQTTWCIVCLEDATVRCLGCEGDVYCARCWREMHVGPAAGYDERGHRWERFDARER